MDSQFSYAPLIWMSCRKTFYSKIGKIHHRSLKVIYGIDDSCNNLLLRTALSQFIKGTFILDRDI